MTKYTSSVVHYHFSFDVVHTDVDRLVNLIPRFREALYITLKTVKIKILRIKYTITTCKNYKSNARL